MKQQILLLLISILSISLVQGNLTVISYPKGLGVEFVSPITYSIANYGLIPYGVRTTGNLKISEPLDACTPPQGSIDGELDLDPQFLNNNTGDLPFILVKRGSCHFTEKSINAAAAGAKLVIIMDNEVGEDISQIVIGDDGRGDNVYVPTIFISEEDGDKLIQLQNAMDMEKENTGQDTIPITMVVEFDVQQTEQVDLKFFINPPERANFELMNTFFKKWNYVEQTTTFTPIYEFYSCPGCVTDNCIRQGRYCAIDMDGDDAGTGRQIAEEYLYQICLLQTTDPKTWWKYVDYQHKKCHQIPYMHQCVMNQIKISDEQEQKIRQCMYPNYTNAEADADIPVLEKQLEIRDLSGIYAFPSVTINNVKYRGSIYGKDVLEAVCAYQKNPSKKCRELIDKTSQIIEHRNNNSGPDVTLIVMVVVGVLVLFFLFMVFIYRRMVTKDIHKEMNTEVNQMVSQYIAFHESKDSSRIDNA